MSLIQRINNIKKLRNKFMGAVTIILVVLTIIDLKLSTDREEDLVQKDIKKWTFIFAENVRVALNTLMREDKMDIRFAMFKGMSEEIKGLKDVRVIRGENVNKIFKEINEKEIIPKQEKFIKRVKEEITDLEEEFAESSDEDEQIELMEEISILKKDIEIARGRIDEAKKIKIVDERERPKDGLDKEVLTKGMPIFKVEGDNARVLIPYVVKKKGCSETSGCHKYAKEGDVLGAINIEFSLADINQEILHNNMTTATLGIVKFAIILTAILLILLVSVTKPITKVVEMLKNIAEGKGDLTQTLNVESKDEVGMLGYWFNEFVGGMRVLVKGISISTQKISSLSDNVRQSSKDLHTSARAQMAAVDETSSSIEEMNSTIKAIAESADEQLQLTEEVSSSVLEMVSSGREVGDNSEHLASSVDGTTSAILEIAASLKEVASNVDILFETTEDVVSATTELSTAVEEISKYAKEKAVLAQKVKEDASTHGISAVNKTKKGMEKIREEVSSTAKAIERLEERSGEIGRIVGVIKEITETTNLLSLNAAIIAAQAGEHGKGFAIVANEVKGLAKRTAASTKEIEGLISLVQEEVIEVKMSMNSSYASVEEGVSLSKEAEVVLTKIVESSEMSFEMARKVESGTVEQSNTLSHVANMMQKICTMVEEIKKATDEQKRSADEINNSTEEMRDTTHQMRRSTVEQSEQGERISQLIIDVTHKMEGIARATSEHRNASLIILKNVETVKDEIAKNVVLSENLDETVVDLDSQKRNLVEKVGSFKT